MQDVDESFFRTPGPKEPVVRVGEDFTNLSLAEGNPPAPNPWQGIISFIQSKIDSLPPFKLPPLPPLPVFPASKPNALIRGRAPIPPEVTEAVAIVPEELNPAAEIIPLVYE